MGKVLVSPSMLLVLMSAPTSRVVQKNLVFVVGLSQRLADSDVLKRHEYFGKFGKIHKVVINQSTSYVGSQVTLLNFKNRILKKKTFKNDLKLSDNCYV